MNGKTALWTGLENIFMCFCLCFGLGWVQPVRSSAQAGGVIFVTPGGAGTRDGSSWANASDLQAALASAGSGSELWVAAGTYRAAPCGDRGASFALKSHVAVFGGFSGVETQRSQRNWAQNTSLLSGDLCSDDLGPQNQADNSYHVASANAVEGAVLDGFTILGGNADGHGSDKTGGGIYLVDSQATLANLVFQYNHAVDGSGLSLNGGSAALTNGVFQNNTSVCGAVFLDGAANLRLSQVTIAENTVCQAGQAAALFHASLLQVNNSILWGDAQTPLIYNDGTGSVTITSSIVYGGWPGESNSASDPQFVDAANGNLRLSPTSPAVDAGSNTAVPADSFDDDGDGNTGEPIPFDLDHHPRVKDVAAAPNRAGAATVVDLGAYENQANSAPILTGFSLVVEKNTPLTLGLAAFAAHFSDADASDSLAVLRILSLPQSGTLTLAGSPVSDGQEIPSAGLDSLIYTPQADFTGSDSFQWDASDGQVYSGAPAAVTLQVNTPPVVSEISVELGKDNTLVFNPDDFNHHYTDSDGNPLTGIVFTSLPQHGTLYLDGVPVQIGQVINITDIPRLVYVPNPNYTGIDSATWNGTDGLSFSKTPVQIIFTITNSAPQVTSFQVTVQKNSVAAFSLEMFSGHYSDAECNPMARLRVDTLPAHGTLRLGSSEVSAGQEIAAADLGSLTYTPQAGYTGADSFLWNGSDGALYALSSAALNLTVVNSPPGVTSFSRTVTFRRAVTFSSDDFSSHFSDADGDPLAKIKILSLPQQGELLLEGSLVLPNQEINASVLAGLAYLPPTDSLPAVSFEWNGSDGNDYALTPALVQIVPLNNPPTVQAFHKVTGVNLPVYFSADDFTGHFSDPEDNSLVAVKLVSLPASGQLKLNGAPVSAGQVVPLDQLGLLSYQPAADWLGENSFEWNASDGLVYAQNPALVTLTVSASYTPTATSTATATATSTATSTATVTPTGTITPSPTSGPTTTSSPTATPSTTPTPPPGSPKHFLPIVYK